MNKAFLFDLDGVLINDEAIWEERKQRLYLDLFGEAVHDKVGSTVGINLDEIYERTVSAGGTISKEQFKKEFHNLADDIYSTAPIPEGTSDLVSELLKMDYHIGVVSASPLSWITTVTKRLLFEEKIELVISLLDRDDLKHKPEPDGYIEAMKAIGATSENTIILEDSNAGIKSAKSSGAFTIGLKQNLISGYVQEGADAYADSMAEVIGLVNTMTKQS